jgi:hypothetical protein
LAITLHIDTDGGPTTGNVIPATTPIYEDQRRHVVYYAGRPTAAKNCCYLAEFAGDLPVVMQLYAHREVTASALLYLIDEDLTPVVVCVEHAEATVLGRTS